MNRRDMLKKSAKMMLVASALAEANIIKSSEKNATNLSTTKKKIPKIVIVGGGWSGLGFAKHIKSFVPNSEVTLVERRDHFVSCPMSNEWLVDLVNLDFLTHSYIDAAVNNNYTYIQAEAVDVDKKRNILKTTKGDLEYDYLVFAVGIEYDYEVWTHGDKKLENRLKREYPAAFIPGSEHITLKEKIKNFKGGNFVMTVPSGNYRCLAAPYERACLVADYFIKNKIDAKVILLDANNRIQIKAKGFSSVFNSIYKNHIDYMVNAQITNLDLDKKIVSTEFDDIHFEDASFYPNVKAPYLLEKMNMTKRTSFNRVEADINQYTYKVKKTDNIYVCGDARPMGFSKSGNTAFSEGVNLARMIADEIEGKKPIWVSPITTCFSLLRTEPERCISLYTEYEYEKSGGMLFKNNLTDEAWKTNGLGDARVAYAWAEGMYASMFY